MSHVSDAASSIQKILIIGNAAGGKTRLSRKLAELYKLPLTHVDSIQFLPGMQMRPLEETRKVLQDVTSRSQWIIDGHGPLDQIENRFEMADRIVFVDLPLATHYLWFLKRQIQNIWSKRAELPEGCNELSFQHTVKVAKTIWKIHKQMRPQLIRILSKENLKSKVVRIQNLRDWNSLYQHGFQT